MVSTSGPAWNGPNNLAKAANHVAHEIRMLQAAWHNHTWSAFAWTTWYVHTRTLMEFFSCGCPKTQWDKKKNESVPLDDICAWHFLHTDTEDGRDTWKEIRARYASNRPACYDEYKAAVDKLAAHLTFERIEYAKKAASGRGYEPSRAITSYLLDLARAFVAALPAGRRQWFPACVDEASAGLRQPRGTE